jgi:hypothetical protein
MGGIVNSIFGGPGSGGGFKAAEAPIQKPVTNEQAKTAYDQQQATLAQQQAFIAALQQQGGVQNQSNVFNQLQGVANGTGPNPAQAQLAQATGANVAAQNALMAGQRGSSANAGLIARQAAQQGANLQQQAAGQGATLQAQQSLGALNQLGGLATSQVNQQQQAQNAAAQNALSGQSNVLNAIGAQNQAQVGATSNMNDVNAKIQGGNQTAQGNLMGGIGSALPMVGKGIGGMMGGSGAQNWGTGGIDAAGQPIGDAMYALADGGEVPSQDPMNTPTIQPVNQQLQSQPQSSNALQFFNGVKGPTADGYDAIKKENDDILNSVQSNGGGDNGLGGLMGGALQAGANHMIGEGLKGLGNFLGDAFSTVGGAGAALGEGAGSLAAGAGEAAETVGPAAALLAAKGGKVPALLSPGETYLPPDKVKKVAKEGKNPLKEGKKVPGKPKHPGNDYRNDTYKTTLKEGGIVIPNSVMQSDDPAGNAAKFVAACLAKNGKMKR